MFRVDSCWTDVVLTLLKRNHWYVRNILIIPYTYSLNDIVRVKVYFFTIFVIILYDVWSKLSATGLIDISYIYQTILHEEKIKCFFIHLFIHWTFTIQSQYSKLYYIYRKLNDLIQYPRDNQRLCFIANNSCINGRIYIVVLYAMRFITRWKDCTFCIYR